MASVRKLSWTHKGVTKEKWVCEYTDVDGKRRRETPVTGLKKDADKIRQRVEREIESGERIAQGDAVTVREACDLFLKQSEDKVRAGSIGRCWHRLRTRIVDNHIVPILGHLHINALTFRDIEAWHGGMLRKMLPMTAKANLRFFQQIEAFAAKRGFTKKQVGKEVCADLGSVQYRAIRTFTLDDVRSLIVLVEEKAKGQRVRGHLFLKCAVQLAAFCGLRFGEIVGLTLDSIDFELGVLKVRHSLTELDEHKGPKTKAGNRDIPLPARVGETLRLWIDHWYVPNPRRLVFRRSNGTAISRSNFHRNFWWRLLRRAGLENKEDRFHFHALRHFAASLMIEQGLPLTDVASLLGHAKFDMTLQVYAHPIVGGNRRREAFERISAALATSNDNPDGAGARTVAIAPSRATTMRQDLVTV